MTGENKEGRGGEGEGGGGAITSLKNYAVLLCHQYTFGSEDQ